jgi:hypothetical protein
MALRQLPSGGGWGLGSWQHQRGWLVAKNTSCLWRQRIKHKSVCLTRPMFVLVCRAGMFVIWHSSERRVLILAGREGWGGDARTCSEFAGKGWGLNTARCVRALYIVDA